MEATRRYADRWTLLSGATFLFWLATQSLRPYLPLHLSALGAGESVVGVAVAAHPFLSLFLAMPAGSFIDLRGLRRFMLLSLAAMSAVGVAYATISSVPQIVGLQAIAGLSELGAWVGMQALVTRIEGDERRRIHLGLFSIVWGLSVALGPTLGAYVYESYSFAAIGILYSACAFGALAAVAGLPYRDEAPQLATPSGGVDERQNLPIARRILHVGRRLTVLATMTASFVMLWANSLRSSFYPLYLERAGIPVRTIGYIMSLAGLTLLICRIPLPWMLRRFQATTLLVFGTMAAVVSLVLTPVIVGYSPALWIAAAVFGVGFGLNSPITIDLIARSTATHERGLAMGMRVASNRLAQVAQPIVFGAIAGPFGMAAGFGVAGLIMSGALVWSGIGVRQMAHRVGNDGSGASGDAG